MAQNKISNKVVPGNSLDAQYLSTLLEVCHEGDVHQARKIIRKYQHLVNLKETERFPLWVAASENHGDLVKCLLENGADVNLRTKEGTSALYIAAERNNLHVVKLLVKNGAEVDIPSNDQSTALWIACQRGYLGMVQYLHKNKANISTRNIVGESALLTAAQFGREDVVAYLIKHGVDVNRGDNTGNTALHVACEHGYLVIVQTLIAAGALIDAYGDKEMTPMMYAVKNRHLEIVKYLIESDAALDTCSLDPDGGTPLHYAAANNLMKTVTLLLGKGAKLMKNNIGEYPSQIAKRKSFQPISEYLASQEAERFKYEKQQKAISKPPLRKRRKTHREFSGASTSSDTQLLSHTAEKMDMAEVLEVIPETVTAVEHENVEIVTSFDGIKDPKVTWLKDYAPIVSDNVYADTEKNQSSLKITSCDMDDNGLYTVLVSNNDTAGMYSARLQVHERRKQTKRTETEQNVSSKISTGLHSTRKQVYEKEAMVKHTASQNKAGIVVKVSDQISTVIDKKKLDDIYRDFLKRIQNDVPECVLRINKGGAVQKIFVVHSGDGTEVSEFLKRKCPDIWKQNLFELREGKSSAKLAGQVTMVKTTGLDKIRHSSSSCLVRINGRYYELTVRHIIDQTNGLFESGPGTRFLTLSDVTSYKGMVGYFGPDDNNCLIDFLLIEIDTPTSLGPRIDVDEVPDPTAAVWKIGAKTGQTNGYLLAKDIFYQIEDTPGRHGYFVVGGNFAEIGDSGALVRLGECALPGKAIGMVIAVDNNYQMDNSEEQKVALCVSLNTQLNVMKRIMRNDQIELFEHEKCNSTSMYFWQ